VLPPESKTGIWTVRVQAGPVSKQKSIRIETIVPNRIKIFSKTDQDHWLDLAVQHTLSVQANWLTGNKASHLEFDADLKISSYDALAQRYKNFCFQDMTITQPQYSFALNKGVLNEEGYGEVPFRINLNERVPGMVKCAFTIRVWEGGGFSSDVFSIVGSPYSSYVGFMLPENQEAGNYKYLECGKKHTVKVMNVQPDGNPIRSGKVEMEVYKLNWKWWWEKTYEGDAEYHSESFMQKILTQTLTTGQSGEGNFTLSFSNDEWGRYVIRMKDLNSGHIAAREVYVDWKDWMSRYNQQSEKSEILVIKSDKEKYKPGDRARINIPVPNHNRVLITLENSTGVLSSEWVESKKGSADYEFEIKPEMFPNIYVCAMAVQSANNYNAYPVRLYGITRINVEDPEVILNPVIDMPDVLRPGQKVNVRLSEKNGKPMNLTLAIVDEGLLDLTKFKTPNPLSYFAESEGYNNRTWDVFSKILRKDLNVDFQRILSVGGDAEFSEAEGAVKRFKPMVRFVGPVYVGKGEKKNLQIQLPPYIGSVRTMVVARSEHAFGSTEKTTPVRSDLMLSGQPPRFSASGDEWMLPVWVFSGSKPMKQIKLKAFATGSGKTESSNEQIISLEKESQTLVYFKIKSSGEGMLNVKVTAECGSEKAEWTAEVPVILPTPVERKIEKFELKEGKNYNKVFAFTGSSSQNTVEANWSGMASIPFSWLYKSSAEYAYTCGEQIISNALTQLLIRDILFADNVNEKEKINKNVMHVLQQLKFYQINKGGISYWPNSENADDWLTSYALFFIRKCEEKSISVPGGLKNKIMQYLKDQAEAWKPEKSMSSCQYYLQAYRLWALSFYRQAGLVLMNRLAGQVAPDRYSAMLLAMAYFNSGFSSAGDAVVKKYGNPLRKNSSLENCYYGRIHDLSVELLYQIQKNRLSDGKKVFDEVARYLQPDQWLSTRETALGLNACVEYLKKAGFDNRLQFKGKWNNQQLLVNTARSSYVQKEVIRKGQQVKFELFNQGKSAIFGQVIQYFKSEPEKETASENGFMIRQNLFYANGVPVEEERLKTGDKINLVVSVTYTGSVPYLEHVVAEIPLPAGWEWMNTWQDENNRIQLPGTDYVDIRDNKVIVYFSATAGRNINFSLPVSVSYPGRFYFPYPRVVATDKPEFYSYGKGRYVNVNISSSEGTAMR
jgi:hypothetical protein